MKFHQPINLSTISETQFNYYIFLLLPSLVLQAKDLKGVDRGGTSDPYVVLTLPKTTNRFQTVTIFKSMYYHSPYLCKYVQLSNYDQFYLSNKIIAIPNGTLPSVCKLYFFIIHCIVLFLIPFSFYISSPFSFNLDPKTTTTLRVEIWDWNKVMKHKLIGKLDIALESLHWEKLVDWYPIPEDIGKGEIQLELKYGTDVGGRDAFCFNSLQFYNLFD